MGANCCIAANDKSLHESSRFEVSAHRNIRHSPSFSFRWDNRTHIEDIMENLPHFSHHNNGTSVSEIKSGTPTETEVLSDRSSPSNASQIQPCLSSSMKTPTSRRTKATVQDKSFGGDLTHEEKDSAKSANLANPDIKLSVLVPSNEPSPSSFKGDPSSSRNRMMPCESISSRRACRSPGYQLTRQISNSGFPALKSLNESSSLKGRRSLVLSVGSTDLSTGGSHDESSDGWSMQTFSELVASSQRERWFLESENLRSNSSKVAQVSYLYPKTLSPDQELCRICSKLLKEKKVHTNEFSAVAVLVCGHFYHADCLENLTPESERYDPHCPICTRGEKSTAKLFGRVESRAKNKISRFALADDDAHNYAFFDGYKRDGKAPKISTSSSMKNSIGKRDGKAPFLRRHFSIGRSSMS